MLTMPAISFAIAVVAAIASSFLGMARALWLLLAIAILVGVAAFMSSANDFQAFLMITSFGFPLIAGSAALGIASGLNIRKRKFFIAVLCLLPFPYFLWSTYHSEVKKKNEEQLALEFITHNQQVSKLIGGPVEVFPALSTRYPDADKGRYEYSIKGKKLYAIVNVSRSSGKPVFSLACVTTLSMGYREAGKDDCQQSPVPLPQL